MRSIALVVLLAGCSQTIPPRHEMRISPACETGKCYRSIRRVVALPASCGAHKRSLGSAMDIFVPLGEQCGLDGVDQLVRSRLLAESYSVVDSETLAVEVRRRREVIKKKDGQEVYRVMLVDGALFGDLPPPQQQQILRELSADAVVVVRVAVGAVQGIGNRKLYQAVVKLHDAEGRFLWASRCKYRARISNMGKGAVEKTVDCAVSNALQFLAASQ